MKGIKSAAVGALLLSMTAIGLAYAAAITLGSTAKWTEWTMAVATPLSLVAMLALGASRPDRAYGGLRPLAIPFAAVLVIMLGAFAAALMLPSEGEPLLLGLPRRAAIVLYGIGILPALILPVAYALTFDELTLTEADIERVREAAARTEKEG